MKRKSELAKVKKKIKARIELWEYMLEDDLRALKQNLKSKWYGLAISDIIHVFRSHGIIKELEHLLAYIKELESDSKKEGAKP